MVENDRAMLFIYIERLERIHYTNLDRLVSTFAADPGYRR